MCTRSPPNPANGQFSCGATSIPGRVCTACNSGYAGSPSATCGVSGTTGAWGVVQNVCTKLPCLARSAPIYVGCPTAGPFAYGLQSTNNGQCGLPATTFSFIGDGIPNSDPCRLARGSPFYRCGTFVYASQDAWQNQCGQDGGIVYWIGDGLPLSGLGCYVFSAFVDSGGNDIKFSPGLTPEQLAAECDSIPTCVGFNSNGWLKNVATGPWVRWTEDHKLGFYMRQPLLHAQCAR